LTSPGRAEGSRPVEVSARAGSNLSAARSPSEQPTETRRTSRQPRAGAGGGAAAAPDPRPTRDWSVVASPRRPQARAGACGGRGGGTPAGAGCAHSRSRATDARGIGPAAGERDVMDQPEDATDVLHDGTRE